MSTSASAAGFDKILGKPLDGVDLIPHLTNSEDSEPHETLFWRKEGMAAVRDRSYKLIRLDGYGYRLYDLETDLVETEDLSEKNPGILSELQFKLESWEKELMYPLWSESKPWQKVTFEIHKALMENREVTVKNPADLRKLENTNK